MKPAILWFRRNLRLTDNLPLIEAAGAGHPIVPVYIVDAQDEGGASRWWLHHSLEKLDATLKDLGGSLVLREGEPAAVLEDIAAQTGAAALYFARRYEPASREQEASIDENLGGRLDIHGIDDGVLARPGSVLTAQDTAYKVFTPFWKAAAASEPPSPQPVPQPLAFAGTSLELHALPELGLLPRKPDWAGGLRDTWCPGEASAIDRLEALDEWLPGYAGDRDRPDIDATSRLSPHLHFGEISVRQFWHAVRQAEMREHGSDAAALLRQLYWREFSTHLLHHFPHMTDKPLREEFERFPWSDDDSRLQAWQRGETGYPIVDAGMRQLWETGWMHNRVRMIVASFLVKDLLIPWQQGADWFLDTLVDADMANNAASWQWVAGCGTDAAPYFRIFNPRRQTEKFDPDGAYVRRWLPEPANGGSYPDPIVDHGEARQCALAAYSRIKGT